jgi:hypothetical protein
MAAENAETGFIKDAEQQPIREKEEKKLPLKKTKQKLEIEQFAHTTKTT